MRTPASLLRPCSWRSFRADRVGDDGNPAAGWIKERRAGLRAPRAPVRDRGRQGREPTRSERCRGRRSRSGFEVDGRGGACRREGFVGEPPRSPGRIGPNRRGALDGLAPGHGPCGRALRRRPRSGRRPRSRRPAESAGEHRGRGRLQRRGGICVWSRVSRKPGPVRFGGAWRPRAARPTASERPRRPPGDLRRGAYRAGAGSRTGRRSCWAS